MIESLYWIGIAQPANGTILPAAAAAAAALGRSCRTGTAGTAAWAWCALPPSLSSMPVRWVDSIPNWLRLPQLAGKPHRLARCRPPPPSRSTLFGPSRSRTALPASSHGGGRPRRREGALEANERVTAQARHNPAVPAEATKRTRRPPRGSKSARMTGSSGSDNAQRSEATGAAPIARSPGWSPAA
eukprot:324334-Chlamydomonas_euryale.AAC.4